MNFHAKAPEKPLDLSIAEIRQQIAEQVAKVVDRKSICWWYVTPEEIRYWRKNEMDYLRAATGAIRAADPLKRPIWMYEPNFRDAASLMKAGKYLDIIGKGVYVNLADYQESRVGCVGRWSRKFRRSSSWQSWVIPGNEFHSSCRNCAGNPKNLRKIILFQCG